MGTNIPGSNSRLSRCFEYRVFRISMFDGSDLVNVTVDARGARGPRTRRKSRAEVPAGKRPSAKARGHKLMTPPSPPLLLLLLLPWPLLPLALMMLVLLMPASMRPPVVLPTVAPVVAPTVAAVAEVGERLSYRTAVQSTHGIAAQVYRSPSWASGPCASEAADVSNL